jgi:photosystem I subunit IX
LLSTGPPYAAPICSQLLPVINVTDCSLMAPRRSVMSSNLLKYLSTAPVIATIWMVITAGILIEFNRFFPDLLLHP